VAVVVLFQVLALAVLEQRLRVLLVATLVSANRVVLVVVVVVPVK
jgi:hypothetical protein